MFAATSAKLLCSIGWNIGRHVGAGVLALRLRAFQCQSNLGQRSRDTRGLKRTLAKLFEFRLGERVPEKPVSQTIFGGPFRRSAQPFPFPESNTTRLRKNEIRTSFSQAISRQPPRKKLQKTALHCNSILEVRSTNHMSRSREANGKLYGSTCKRC